MSDSANRRADVAREQWVQDKRQADQKAMLEEEVRRIVREEIARALDGIIPYNKP